MANRNAISIGRWVWFLVRLTILAAIVGGIVWWIRFQPVAVQQHAVARGAVAMEVMGTGTLEARIRTTISPRIPGRIEAIPVDQGERVQAGQILVRLDDAELTQQVAIARADLETRQAALTRLESDIARAAAVLKQAETNYDRLNSLVEQRATSRDELDKATEALAIAGADSSRSAAAITEGRKALIVAERNLEFQQTKLADSRILAPFDGLIVRRDRDPGDVVVPGSSILLLISTDQLWISAWVDETEMAQLESGQSARVVFRSEPQVHLPGRLVRLGKETDRETREFVIDVEIMRLPQQWAVGQRAEVFIETAARQDVLLVPGKFIQRRPEQTGVFVNRSGLVAWQPVEAGLSGHEFVEIKSGLQESMQVILPENPGGQLHVGQRIAGQ